MKKIICIVGLAHATLALQAQTYWDLAGNPGVTNGSILGSTNVAPLTLYTGNVQRSRLYPGTNATIGAFTGVNQAGYWGFGRNANTFPVGAYSRVHLGDLDQSTWQGGFRPLDVNGITFTGNNDHAYIGQWREDYQQTSMMISWSNEYPLSTLPEWLRFNHRWNFNPAAAPGSPAHTLGKDIAVMTPDGFFGIGDYRTAGVAPTHPLDVLFGTARIRQLYGLASSSADRVVMSDPTGVLYTAAASAIDCKWSLGGGTNGADVNTASGTSTTCPSEANLVNIGTGWVPNEAKLNVRMHGVSATTNPTAVTGDARADSAGIGNLTGVKGLAGSPYTTSVTYPAGECRGVSAYAGNASQYNHGVDSWAEIGPGYSNTYRNMVIQTRATMDGTGFDNLGCTSVAEVRSTGSAELNEAYWGNADGHAGFNHGAHLQAQGATGTDYGIWAQVLDTSDWAAYFIGPGYITGGSWSGSDANLKHDIQDLAPDESRERIMQLRPTSFLYNTQELPRMNFPEGLQRGFIAQDLEQVYPELVKEVHQPQQIDPNGEVSMPELQFKAIRIEGITADLVATVQSQQHRIDQLQEQLSACCTNVASAGQRSMTTGTNDLTTERLLITPNPFTDHTTVKYYVPQAARISLQVSDSMGKPSITLREEQAIAGAFTYEWNTQSLAPGTYFVALLVDGTVAVKKAVKVGER